MKIKSIFPLLVAGIVAGGATSYAAKGNRVQKPQKPQQIRVFAGQVYGVEPDIEAALMLTDDQRTKIEAARKETVEAPALVELRKKAGDKRATDADRNAAREQLKTEQPKAQAELKKRIDDILTADQKAFIQKVDDSYKATEKDVRQQFNEKLKADFSAKLAGALSQEQKDALAKAKAPK